MAEAQRLACQRVMTSDGVLDDVALELRDGRITAITQGEAPGGAETVTGWVVPGFVDTHVHGGGGADYATTDRDEALRARDFHRRHGTTTSFASLVTADLDTIVAQIETLVPLVSSGDLAGIHLEGPFLSAAKCGAHHPSLLRAPEPASLDRLLEAGQGAISMITIAPELPGALDAIERLTAAGVTAAVGHTDGDESIVAAALDAGATVATHLFNAMRPIHHREPGPIPRLLSDERVTVELICDGFHLHRDVIAMAIAAAGPDRVALVTDAMVAAGMSDGSYRLGDLEVRVGDGMARLVGQDGEIGSIAGSTLTMADAFAFVVRNGASIVDAATMAATTPARRHELAAAPYGEDAAEDAVGEIRVGARADLCVVDEQGFLQRVMQGGRWVDTT
jgi:N-acetylglucosamine-6-phosphate deacetylase